MLEPALYSVFPTHPQVPDVRKGVSVLEKTFTVDDLIQLCSRRVLYTTNKRDVGGWMHTHTDQINGEPILM